MERELLLLGVLRQGEMHGYQLHDFIEKNLAFCTDLKKPTAYVLLEKMQTAGWIEAREERDGNRPNRHVYRLTQKGEEMFLSLLRENLATFESAKTGSDIGLAFMDALPKSQALGQLQQRRAALAAQVALFDQVPEHKGSFQLLIDHQRHYLHSELAWLDNMIDRASAKSTTARAASSKSKTKIKEK